METKMKRRKFMGLAIGIVLAPKILCRGNEKETKSYSLADDLLKEIIKHNKEYPNQTFQYFIYCNRSGLGWLESNIQTNASERFYLVRNHISSSRKEGYQFILWSPYCSLTGRTSIYPMSIGIVVSCCATYMMYLDDVRLLCKEYDNGRYFDLKMVARRRNDNIDYTEEGMTLLRRIR